MSLSDDEDDFLSADEDTYDDKKSDDKECDDGEHDGRKLDEREQDDKESVQEKSNEFDEPNSLKPKTTFSPPPAPPPTPALSSSFSNSTEPTMIVCSSNNNSPSVDTQFKWRVPNRVGSSTPATRSDPEQTKQALDRLAENLSRNDKNLFEKVAEDLKKVSLKLSKDIDDGTKSDGGPSIPLISDLGSAFGGWGWDSASKLIASSASQVTSLTGTVLDTLVSATSLEPNQPTSSIESHSVQSVSESAGPSKTHRKLESDDGLVRRRQ